MVWGRQIYSSSSGGGVGSARSESTFMVFGADQQLMVWGGGQKFMVQGDQQSMVWGRGHSTVYGRGEVGQQVIVQGRGILMGQQCMVLGRDESQCHGQGRGSSTVHGWGGGCPLPPVDRQTSGKTVYDRRRGRGRQRTNNPSEYPCFGVQNFFLWGHWYPRLGLLVRSASLARMPSCLRAMDSSDSLLV